MRPSTAAFLTTGALALVPESGSAQLLFDGAEFQVNTYTTLTQYAESARAVSRSSDGSFVVVWTSYYQDGSSASVHGQRFDAAGAPDGTEFQVNSHTTSVQRAPAVASAPGGSFVVVWQSYAQDGHGFGVFGQRFDAAGAPNGTEFQVNSYTTHFQVRPVVSSAADGSFVVAWSGFAQDGSDYGVFGQRFDAAGAPAGTEFQVNTYTTSVQRHPAVAVAADASFVVAWASLNDGSITGIAGQRFDAAGAPAGTEFQVNSYTTGFQYLPTVAVAPDSSFVVVWQSQDKDGSSYAVAGQRYDAAGAPDGTEFLVNTYTTSAQLRPDVASAADGGFVVVWQSFGNDGSGNGVFGCRFDPTGTPEGTEFQINTYTTSIQQSPAVASGGSDDFVVVWSSYAQDGNAFGVFGQRLCSDANANLVCDSAEATTTTTVSTTTSTTTSTTNTTTTSSTTTSTLPTPLCGPAPEPDGSCNLADPILGPGKSSLSIKNDTDNTKDTFKWKWNKGVATALGDFQTPTALGSTYRVCVYDASASPQPIFEAEIPNGGVAPTCGTQPCWKPTGTTGFKYKDTAGTSDGMTGAKLKAGTTGKSQVQARGKGSLLGPPSTGAIAPSVVVQFLIDDGVTTECFKTTFSTFTLQNATQYKAKGP